MAEAALLAASLGIGVFGILQGASAQADAAEFNATALEQQAARERQVAGLEAAEAEREGSRAIGRDRALRSASGVAFTGTPLLVDEDTVGSIAFNSAIIRAGGNVSATRLQQQAQIGRIGARSTRTGGFFRAGETLLTGAAQFA